MPIQSSDFLASAISLAGTSGEMNIRNSISRAYYYAYHTVSLLADGLPGVNLKPQGVGIHEHLAWRLINMKQLDATFSHSSITMAIGYLLKQMKLVRRAADYDLEWIESAHERDLQLSNCKKVADKVSALQQALRKTA